ncbi:MAG: hypothetical protein JSW41_00100 [Candidatus Aenigmatarchaeota archaeon]|nr:MAG: hypothetical protein JSW41_00100 [Candidatus Aenigmarchaeota archaeon]
MPERIGDWESWETRKKYSLYDPIIIGEKRSIHHGDDRGKLPVGVALEDVPDVVQVSENQSPTIITRPKYKSRVGFMPAGEEKTKNPYKRWRNKVGKAWKAYTDFGNPIEMWKPLVAQLGANVFGSIESGMPIPEERHGFIENVGGAFVTMLRTDLEQYSHNAPYQIMPALRRHLSAAEGASDLEYLYVYDKVGDPKEYVIYLSGGEIPEENLLREHIDYVDANSISPYEDPNLPFRNRIQGLFDTKDGPPVLNVATLFDYSDYFVDEPQRAHRWAVKDDSWLANQYGPRQFAMEAALPADLQVDPKKVKIYKRPVSTSGFWYHLGALLGDESPRSGRMWLEWVLKKPVLTYIPTDFVLEPIEMALEGRLPTEVMRSIVYEKAKGAAAAWRGFSNPRPHYLWYGDYSP